MNKLETNVLILGKSGVGKSSFINYIYGQNIRENGAGKPFTPKGLYKVTHEVEHIIVNIYDTWGLEANKVYDWKKIVLDEVNKHNEQNSIKDWFHTIYYCFSASTARIEDFEIKEILKPLIMNGNKVTLIITHCDVRGAEEKSKGMIEKLLKELPISELDIIKVCSERKKLLGGKIKEPFGKEEVLERLKSNLWEDIKIKTPKQYELYITDEIKRYREEVKNTIEYVFNNKLTKYTLDDIYEYINQALNNAILRIEKITKEYLCDIYMYYINLVKYIYIDTKRIEYIHTKNNANFKISDNDIVFQVLEFLDKGYIKELLQGFKIPISNMVDLVESIVIRLGKKHIKDKIIYNLELQYNQVLQKIPTLTKKLELFMDAIDMEKLLLM